MKKIGIVFVISIVVVFVSLTFAGREYDPQYEANRALRTAFNGEIFTGNEEADRLEIHRLMKLPRYITAFPTGELAKSHWLFVDESLQYVVEFDWRKNFNIKGKVIFNRVEKRKKK